MGNHEFCTECGESDFHQGEPCDPVKKAAWIKHQAGGSTENKIKESKWIEFVSIDPLTPRKTKIWGVQSKNEGIRPREQLGEIYWFGAWRKYCFFPGDGCVFEQDCLRDIADFCQFQTMEYIRNKELP